MTVVDQQNPPNSPPPVETVRVTVDGFELDVPKGALIIRVAEQIGVQIPRFCDHPLLEPLGACRQCIVEVEGQRKPMTACTTTVADGMVIKTQLTSAVAEKAQRGMLELLLINHPLDCPVCDKGGECPLQNQAMSNGSADSRYHDPKRTFPKPIAISTQVLLDRERCVQCARCTRFSQEIAGDPFIELFERGADEQVAVDPGHPFNSYFSGNTVQICPVGALTGTQYRFRARPFDLMSTPSVCEHCASGCAQRTDWRRGKVMRRLAGDDPDVNQEWNCDKGRWAFQYATARDRIMKPMARDDDGKLVEVSWPEALQRAADGLTAAKTANGVGVLPGGRLTVEDAYAYAKFARVVLGTNDIDMRARPHSVEELEFLAARVAGVRIGHGAVTYRDLDNAPAVLLVGFEPEEESPIVFLRLRKAMRKNQTQVFAIAPFQTDGLRKLTGTLLSAIPGEESSILTALANNSNPSVSTAAEAIRQPGAVILVGERLAQSVGGLSAAAALAEATGVQLAWIPRRAGERGAIDAGALPNLLPGGRPVLDATERRAVSNLWGADFPAIPGRDATEMLSAAAAGQLSGLLIGGVDIADMADPEMAESALAAVDFVVSLEMLPSSVMQHADVVLPVAPAVEKAGTYLNWEGRPRPFDETLVNTGAMSDGRVLNALADTMDVQLGLSTVDAARGELAQLGVREQPGPVDPQWTQKELPAPEKGQAVLATWQLLLDDGSLQMEEPSLAGTRKAPQARLSAATAAELGVANGELVAITTEHGQIAFPLVISNMPDRVVWIPARTPGFAVHSTLAANAGDIVSIAAGGAT